MHPSIETKRLDIAQLCVRYRVSRLDLFGSGTGDSFDPARSDLDFLVQFQAMSPIEQADCFFGLKEGLEAVLDRPVDLVELAPIRNPYLLAAIESTRIQVYAA